MIEGCNGAMSVPRSMLVAIVEAINALKTTILNTPNVATTLLSMKTLTSNKCEGCKYMDLGKIHVRKEVEILLRQ